MKFVVVLIALFALSCAQHCRECEEVVAFIESFAILEKATQENVLEHAERLCNVFPAPSSAQCLAALKANGPQIYKAIMDKTAPEKVCTTFTLCPNAKAIDLTTIVRNAIKSKARDPTTCFLCTSIFQYAEGYIAANATEQQVEDFLNNVICPLLGPFSAQCVQLVQDYPQIIQYLIDQESPAVACGELQLCPQPKPAKVAKIQTGDPVSCSLCTYVVALLEDYITDNTTEAQLQDIIMNQICPGLPSEFQLQCQTFAKELPQYLSDLEKNEPPVKACTDAGICPAPKKSPRLSVNH